MDMDTKEDMNQENQNALTDTPISPPAEKHEAKSLEDHENEAMAVLLKKPSANKLVPTRPATGDNLAGSSSNIKANTAIPAKKIFGCIRCRGNPNGCDSCHSDNFGGKRFKGRADYNTWVQKQAAAGKQYR